MTQQAFGHEIVKDAETFQGRVALRINLATAYLREIHGVPLHRSRIGRALIKWSVGKYDSADEVYVRPTHPLLKEYGGES